MAEDYSVKVSTFDCEILRSAFRKAVIEEQIPTDRWREFAMLMVREFIGQVAVEPDLLDRIVRK